MEENKATEFEETKETPKAETRKSTVIGEEEVKKALETLSKYKEGKTNLENNIVENEKWFKMRHSEFLRRSNSDDPTPSSAWLLNSILNKHADAMDSFPEPNVLAREQSDKATAEMLSSILPVVLEQNDYEQVYSQKIYDKVNNGTGIEGIFWDSRKNNGIGDITIRTIDLLSIFWEPGIKDIQDSRNVFTVELVDNDLLLEQYPQLENKVGAGGIDIKEYQYDDTVDTTEKSVVVDWYYKKQVGNKTVLHYAKICNEVLLYSSENEEGSENGWYIHGKYPFVFDVMFPQEGTPCGFGYIDTMKECQLYIDKLNQVILKNAIENARRRYFINTNGGVNETEFSDWTKELVHVDGNLGADSIREIITQPLSSATLTVLSNKIEELKETSGNRDFSQGGTTSGVTAASAIAALQEAGSKLSRDMNRASYNAYAEVCYFCIDLMRQFYDEPRTFRITGESGEAEYVKMDNSDLQGVPLGDDFGHELGNREPIFDIKVAPQKASPFSKISNNELAKEMYSLGFFAPQNADQALACLDMMYFDQKQTVINKVSQNGTMFQTIQQMQGQIQQLTSIVDSLSGTNLQQGASQNPALAGAEPKGSTAGRNIMTDSLGQAFNSAVNTTSAKAKEKAYNMGTPK